MKYNFDDVINRNNTLSYKWDGRYDKFPENPNVIPMWLADMDFPCPSEISDAVKARAEHPIYGYSFAVEKCKDLTAQWQKKRNNWNVSPEWVAFSNGVVPALNAAITAFTDEGDGVIIQPPVYYPFSESITNNFRKVCANNLIYNGERWTINFEELEQMASEDENKLLILCNPHNPVSRCFEYDELKRIGEICIKHNVIIVSDEIHSDLVFRGNRHIPIASISSEISAITLTAVSPSKTFNTAGLQMSAIIASNKMLLDEFVKDMGRKYYISNLFGTVAFVAAYENSGCVEYLEQLIDYLWSNYLYLDGFLREHMPKIRCQKPEATYLMWLDCSELGMSGKEIERFFIEEAGVAFDSGEWFGGNCSKYMRINIACPRATLKNALYQMKAAYDRHGF